MEWTIYNVLSILIETVQLENISIIVKVSSRSFELCIVCLLKCLWTKLQGNDQNFWIIPRSLHAVLLDFSLTVKAATLIFISGPLDEKCDLYSYVNPG